MDDHSPNLSLVAASPPNILFIFLLALQSYAMQCSYTSSAQLSQFMTPLHSIRMSLGQSSSGSMNSCSGEQVLSRNRRGSDRYDPTSVNR